jgi:hypothetical protein
MRLPASAQSDRITDFVSHIVDRQFDNVRFFMEDDSMRDDIHKKVPRPYRVQQWVKRSVNDADRLNGRALEALNDAIRDYCNREISPSFRLGMKRKLESAPSLFGPLSDVDSPRDVGGRGGPLEADALSETKRLIASGQAPQVAFEQAVARVCQERVQADIRATEPALLKTRDPKAKTVLSHMQGDASKAAYAEIAREVCDGGSRVPQNRAQRKLSADEDLLGGRAAGGAR